MDMVKEETKAAQVDNRMTALIRQAVVDYVNSLPPAAKEATSAYLSEVLNRTVVLAAG